MKKNSNDRQYAIMLLIASIDSLARDLSVKTNSYPNYLVTETMLAKALTLQYQGLDRVNSILENDYGWLVDQIENLVY